MDKLLIKLIDFTAFLKVGSMCVSALYLTFWFYRFLDLWGAERLIPFFDFFVYPIANTFKTQSIYNGAVIEMAYFWFAIIFMGITFIFSRIEAFIREIKRRYDIKTIIVKESEEEKLNKELETEYNANILKYKFYSFFIKLNFSYINEIIALQKVESLENCSKQSYEQLTQILKSNLYRTVIEQKDDSIFIKCNNFYEFDKVIEKVLNAIKLIKIQNSKNAINTDFMLLIDAQTSANECENSYEILKKISGIQYLNCAVVTAQFKMRFDLYEQKSKYMTDILGFSALENAKDSEDETDFYLLKSKPKSV